MGYGVLSSGTSSIRPMHGSRCLLVKCCKKGLNVTLTDWLILFYNSDSMIHSSRYIPQHKVVIPSPSGLISHYKQCFRGTSDWASYTFQYPDSWHHRNVRANIFKFSTIASDIKLRTGLFFFRLNKIWSLIYCIIPLTKHKILLQQPFSFSRLFSHYFLCKQLCMMHLFIWKQSQHWYR